MGHHTYMREAMPDGMRATCSLCCRPIQVIKSGRTIRHGWKEQGRKVGEIGLGFQWGECPGTRSRPLEQTDEDGLVHLGRIRSAIESWQAHVARHVAGDDHYDRKIRKSVDGGFGAALMEAWDESGLEVIERKEVVERAKYGRETKFEEITYRIPRGFVPSTGSKYGRSWSVTSYEDMRFSAQQEAEYNLRQLREAERMLIAAIEHHSKTDPVRKAETHERVLHGRWPRTGRPICGSRGYSSITTEDNLKVTCSRCRKALDAREARS